MHTHAHLKGLSLTAAPDLARLLYICFLNKHSQRSKKDTKVEEQARTENKNEEYKKAC